ncbi:MAG: ABC transporter permease [Chloroflexi bacterium]|nr:MAG: ABC transporter permease [Chloroflexota bacterium]
MNFLSRTFAIFAVAIRRLLSQRGLALATAAGLVVSIALVMSVPLYTDAVYYEVLKTELSQAQDETVALRRPPFAFMFRYVGSLYGLKELDDIEAVDSYLTGEGTAALGLPHQFTVRYAKTDNFRLFPTDQVAYADVRDPLAWVNFAFVSDMADHVTFLEGGMPAVASSDPSDPLEVAVTEAMADQLGLQIGEPFMTFRRMDTEGGQRVVQIPIVISGIWTATNPADEYWFYRLSVFDNQLFIPEASFQGRVAPLLTDEIAQALWYIVMDGSHIHANDVGWLVARIEAVQQRAATLLANTRLEISPYAALNRYRVQSQLLNVLLYAFSIPIIGLLIAFIGLVVGLAVGRQRNEIAVLRSRGATALQILGIAVLESFILGALALGTGIPVSEMISRAIGATRSFLNFTIESNLRVDMTAATLRFGLAALGVTLVAQVVPSLGAARHTIITYKQESARTVRPPWWQRAWLDILLLIPAGYGAYLLQQQGSIVLPGATNSGGVFDNPLLFLVPSLGALALTLLVLRLLPLLMMAVAWVAARTNSVGFLLATRYLSRDPGFYTAPLILLILTLSLSAFTASLAQTLDNHLYDQSYYRIGADVRLVELGQSTEAGSAPGAGLGGEGGTTTPASSTTASGEELITGPRWVFVPVGEHLKAPEIEAAARVGKYGASLQVQGQWREATLYGVDRIDFPLATYWRRDFAPASLGALMNALAVAPEGILLRRDFMAQNRIRVGDEIQMRVSNYGQRAEMTAKVVGEIDYFPTWYPDPDPTKFSPVVVGNLEYIFEISGGEMPYDVWAKTQVGADYGQMVRNLREHDIIVVDYQSAANRIANEQRRPERQGLFGVLSVGFLAAAFLTVLGFFLYALFSFRRRFIELGTLRAIGLSPGQMTTFLAWELAFLIVLGLGAGTYLGALISQIFIPYLQIGSDIQSMTPPFQVEIAWAAIARIYVLFALLFVVALSVLVAFLLRMKIFQAIKLGETV